MLLERGQRRNSANTIDPDTKAQSVMEEIDILFARLDQDQNIDQIRLDIADLIWKCLINKRDTFGYWEKVHLANAIGLLARNVLFLRQSSTFLLRLSLINVKMALVPPEQRSEGLAGRDDKLDSLTFDQLVDDVRKLGSSR